MAALLALAWLALARGAGAGAGAGAGWCPPACACAIVEWEQDYQCGGVHVRALTNDFAKITCKDVKDLCAEMPTIGISSNDTLNSVSLSGCPVPDAFACLLRRLGATDALKVTLMAPAGALTSRHVEGLRNTTMLVLMKAADQTRVPYDVLTALPALRDFRLRGAKLQLPTDESSDLDESSEFPAHPSLQFVELSSDLIEEVPPAAFTRLRGVPQLHLWDNRISGIHNDSFIGMESLEELDLSRNPLKWLSPGVFSHTPKLKVLTLVATKLEEIPTGAITGLQAMEEIMIKFGSNQMTFGDRALADLPSLKKLTIDRCKTSPLPSALLHGDVKLQELVVTGSGVQGIPKGFFDGLVNLQVLDLKDNAIRVLDSDVFRPLRALQRLNLNGNRIEVLPAQLFAGLRRLISFSADANQMRSIADDAFQGAVNLQTLSLAQNRLTLSNQETEDAGYMQVERYSPFSSLSRLRVLSLSHNQMARVCHDWQFLLIQELRVLDLRYNNYTTLTREDVQFLNANITIDMRQNKIETIDVSEAPTWLSLEETPKNTSSVMLLDENPFKCDCQLYTFVRRLRGSRRLVAEPNLYPGNATCSSPPHLKGYLVRDLTPDLLICPLRDEDCPENCICNVRPATESLELNCDVEPKKYPAPDEFGLTKMYLTLRRPPKNLETLPDYVVFLNLSGTGLTEVSGVPESVKQLDLSNNLLRHPPAELIRDISVYLQGNPFVCDCSHVESVNLLQINMVKIPDFGNVTCIGGESPWRINTARLCDVQRAIILGGALAAFGVIIAVAAALAYKYSLQIRVFLFSKGWCLKMLKEEELDHNMEYDAFVSFSQKDARWVAEELVPKLEGERNLRLCVHYRDWLVGDMIPAQIARSVEQSRRTIIVLSKNFLESSWALLEFRAAHLRSQRERKARVLVVVLEDLPSENDMDAELRAYLSTNTYLKWGDPWFWEKLIYALPHRRSKLVLDKSRGGALQTRLTADGKIFNGSLKVDDELTKY
ncbi:unnamed protein product [Diatraea saccharalis]|uniref:TIR domain-containing protein n=1 Tax=Diatraea saccharalis TaxID=40085 RepID=A0A9N9WGE1_9NEOP|nr:unnamed protein product [Diatraea saccharalis]